MKVKTFAVFESEKELRESFERFEKKTLEEYRGDYHLSPEKLFNMFIESVKQEEKASGVLVGGDLDAYDVLWELYEEEEKQKQYDEIMSRYVDEERALKIIRENLPDFDSYFGDNYEGEEKQRVIAEKLELKKSRDGYYYITVLSSEEVLEGLDEKLKELKEKLGEEYDFEKLIDLFYERANDLLEKEKDSFINPWFVLEDYELKLCFRGRDLTSGYTFDFEGLARNVLEYMKERGEFLRVLDFWNYFKEDMDADVVEDFYVQALNNPTVERLIERAREIGMEALGNIEIDVDNDQDNFITPSM